MPPKKIKTKAVDRSDYKIYLKKANEFYDTMIQAKEGKKWNAVGLNAVHCVISSSDAMLIFYKGIRSTNDSHLTVIDLLNSINLTEIKSKCMTLRRILVKKNLVEYENRDFTQNEAFEIFKCTKRFYNWVILKIGKSL